MYNSNMAWMSLQLLKKLYNTITRFYCPSEQQKISYDDDDDDHDDNEGFIVLAKLKHFFNKCQLQTSFTIIL